MVLGRKNNMKYKINYGEGLENIEAFFFDMDGTLYLGMDRLEGTLELLDLLKKSGKKIQYITNNSSKNRTEYVAKMTKLGIPACKADFFSSSNALVYLLKKEHPGAKIYAVATPGIEKYIESEGFTLVREYTTDPEKVPDFALLTYDTTLTYDKIRIFCDYVKDGVTYIATHPDMVCPAEGGKSMPDIGSFMLMIEGATGKRPSLIAGKPNPTMVEVCAEKLGLPVEKVCVVGDRLNTDVMSGVNAGAKTICVLTGETDLELLETSDTHPDYVFDSVKEVYEYLRDHYA